MYRQRKLWKGKTFSRLCFDCMGGTEHNSVCRLNLENVENDYVINCMVKMITGAAGQTQNKWRVLRCESTTEKKHSREARGRPTCPSMCLLVIFVCLSVCVSFSDLCPLTSLQQTHVMVERSVLLKGLQHPFLVGLHFSFQTTNLLYFVLDYVNGGDVCTHYTLREKMSVLIERK